MRVLTLSNDTDSGISTRCIKADVVYREMIFHYLPNRLRKISENSQSQARNSNSEPIHHDTGKITITLHISVKRLFNDAV